MNPIYVISEVVGIIYIISVRVGIHSSFYRVARV